MIVVDVPVLANALGDDGADGRKARGALRRADDLPGPDLLDVETVAVLSRRWLPGAILTAIC